MGGLFDDDEGDVVDDGLPAYEQDGPDLFGAEPDELILPTEPTPVDDPEMDLPLDEYDEIPIDPEESDEADAEAEGGIDEAMALVAEPAASEPEGLAPPPPAPKAPTPPARPDAPLALYRRYRPDTFDQVIGQEHVTVPLQRALTNNRVNHAYLFSGPRGCGKTTSARILARCLNCEQGPTPMPCGTCQSCRDLARGGAGSIDVIEIDAASHGGVDEARDLRERAFFAPVHSRYKIYIIDEAHMVTPQGFNALLKVVEEPPPHVKFIFATTEPEKVIGTIRSRTHHYPFRLVPPRTLTAYLSELCTAEGVSVDDAVLPLVVRAGAGSVRDSLSVLDQLLGGAAESGVSYQQATRLLGYTPDSLLDEIMDAFAAGDSHGVFACIDKVIEVGQDPRRFSEDLLRRLRDLIVIAAVPDALATGLVDVAADQGERLTTQANGMGPGELARAAEVIAKGLTDMRGTTAPRLHLELMCARVLLPGADVDERGVHARLDRIERRLQMAAGAESHAPRPERSDAPAPAPAPAPSPQPGPAPRPRLQPEAPPQEQPPRRPEARPVPEARPEPAPRSRPEAPAQPDPWQAPPQPPAPAPRPDPQPAAPAAPAASGNGDPAVLTTAQVRGRWPEVLDAIKKRRRVTWIVVRENAQVHDFTDGVLTLAFNNPGAQESFSRGGSDQVVRESVLEVLGVAPTIRAIAGNEPPPPPAPAYQSAPAPEPVQQQPPAAAPPSPGAEQARANIQATQVGPIDEEAEAQESPDDIDLDDDGAGADELLAKHLGAELIGEEEPEL
ncbi:DNA polymerase III subunit gamma and tau [Propioniciclava sp. MC1595]|uniref:DNA polymerase III subunit gamma and tau n=1 Tax=Propioniciclava sp. MC1595 TaxID=2760308 RepID=UPI0016625A5F|nr:DNA polymerase III subunit gamma and tau [Propioniciclava sp. MC1595]MBB1496343.1 DNA polymerase III subunit gamma and tau [Propioniciclava sp. MC1595]QTE27736.1 DNA polymerase III subunit gamma and tau [Propioniciclava sp. MC1595]